MSLASYGARRSGSPLTGLVSLIGIGLLLGIGLAIFLGLPRLSAAWPPAGAQAVSSRASLRLTFNRPMNQASVEAGLTLAPDVPGAFSWEGNTLVFRPALPWEPGTQVNVSLNGGRSARGLPLLGSQQWAFSIGRPRLAYLAGTPPNLWITGLEPGDVAQPLTNEPFGVYDYAASPDSAAILYSARREDGGADLRLLRMEGEAPAPEDWLACPGEACVSPTFSPGSAAGEGQVAYQRHQLVPGLAGDQTLGPAHVYVRELSGEGDRQASEGEARYPRWAPDGRLSYFDLERSAIVVHDLASGGVTYVPTSSGEMGTWSSDGQSLIFPDLFFTEHSEADHVEGEPEPSASFYLNLVRVTVATNEIENLSGGEAFDDASAALSPASSWLAFGRKLFTAGQWTPGRQLWLMRPDGSDARALTDDPLYNHSAFHWSPDSAAIAYMRFKLADPGDAAEIWIIEVQASGLPGAAGPRRLVAGYLPEWLP